MDDVVTVVIMTFNQASFIKKTLDSVLSQKTTFKYNVLIHDDCSSDGTYEILLDYKKKDPDRIVVIRQNERRFLIDGFNSLIFNNVVPQIKTKYVAYCDGDDYWCDDYKLQKQYDFMESHREYSMCFHNAYQLKPGGDISSKWYINKEGDLHIDDFINDKSGVPVATSSVFIKSEVFNEFEDWRMSFPIEDRPMYINASIRGKIYRLPEIMCVYRQFAQGSWSLQNKIDPKRKIAHYEECKKAIVKFDIFTNHIYYDLVTKYYNKCSFMSDYYKGDLKAILSKKNREQFRKLALKTRISLKLKYKFPKIYSIFIKINSK